MIDLAAALPAPIMLAATVAVGEDRLPRREILALGDSLTAAGYAELVGARFGVPVVNAGIGGQSAAEAAARYGAWPVSVVVQGGRLLPGPNLLTTVAPELFRAMDTIRRDSPATLAGIRGIYVRSRVPGTTIDVNQFTPGPGQRLPAVVPPGSTMRLERAEWQRDILLVCVGRNRSLDDAPKLLSQIAAIMAAYRPRARHIVLLGIPNSALPEERRGTPGHARIVALNRELARRYPDNFVDIRAAYNGAGNMALAEDRGDRLLDVPPQSLRRDHLHYNDAGRRVWAQAVGDFIARKGWLRAGGRR